MAKTKVPGGYIDDGSITSSHLHSSHGITTNDIAEHTNNKYYTDARVDARLNETTSGNFNTTGTIRITADSTSLTIGAGNDLRFSHNGTNSFITNVTGSLVLRQEVDDGDIIFQSDDGSGGVAQYFRLDGGNTNMVASKTIVFSDSVKASFGDAEDLQIFHDGSNSIIKDNGTGNLRLQTGNSVDFRNGSGSDLFFRSELAGDTTLYHNKVAKLATTSTGIDVTGEVKGDSLDIDGAGDISGNLVIGGNLTVSGTTTTLNTATLDVEDKNITINKGSGDTSGSANGAGITIQDAVNASTDATILWDASDDEFDFNQDTSLHLGEEYRSPGWDRLKKKLVKWKK